MRKFLYLFLILFGAALTAQAQTAPPEKPSEKAPTKEASKPEQFEAAEKLDRSIDLDSFFKKGEENAKNGTSCNKPATPADPIA